MSILDFSRGEISPEMRYRSDLQVYHRGVESMFNTLPTPQGGTTRRYGTQVVGTLPVTTQKPAIRTFNLGATGLNEDIEAPGSGLTVTVNLATYDTEDRVEDLAKNTEIQIILAFSETNVISAYWINTASGVPAYLQQLWNYSSGYLRPTLGFDDTRDVRVAQIENSVYIVASGNVYELYWDITKSSDTSLLWDATTNYAIGDVVYHTYSAAKQWYECITAHDSSTLTLEEAESDLYWKIVYPPYLSWRDVTLRVGEKLLTGSIEDDPFDPLAWNENITWAIGTAYDYKKGDVVLDTAVYYECITAYSHVAGETFVSEAAYWLAMTAIASVTEEVDTIYRRRAAAGREQTIPREIKAHHGRLLVCASSRFPATIFGSEIGKYTKYGAGIYDDDPWIYTISGDRVGKILWMYVTDQLYLGTKGGIFAVSGVITPGQFLLRKVNSHAASEIEGVTAAGSLLYFQSDKKTLREVSYVDQVENSYQAMDLTIFSTHIFKTYDAVKMVVQHSPHTIIWILRSDGVLVSLSYEKTTDMVAFARHEVDGDVIDISGGVGDDLYAIVERTSDTKLLRMGKTLLIDGDNSNSSLYLDGLVKFVMGDPTSDFEAYVQNDDFRAWLITQSITTVALMQAETGTLDASDESMEGYASQCALRHLTTITAINLSTNSLTTWASITVPASWVTINFSDNSFIAADINQILVDVAASQVLSSRTGTINLSSNVAATYAGLVAATALYDAGWTVTLDNAAGWEDGYNLTFNVNGGTGSPTGVTAYIGGEAITIAGGSGGLTYSGFEFVGWNTQSDGSGTTYQEDDPYTMPLSDTILYAKWAATYAMAYDGNGSDGGSVPGTVNYQASEEITVASNSATKTGSTFSTWNTAANGSGTDRAPASTFPMPTDAVTLYAQWTINYDVGDPGPAGGIIFYKSGSTAYEAAPIATEFDDSIWGSPTVFIRGTSKEIGTGAANTVLITAGTGGAARLCSELSHGGYDDWFLPSLYELEQMYLNLKVADLGDFADDDYWSSWENATGYAGKIDFTSGNQVTGHQKTFTLQVRAARSFTVE